MKPAAVLRATAADPRTPLDRYGDYVDSLDCGSQGKRLRVRAARAFVSRFDDLAAWMERSTPTRLLDLERTKAWPFVTWCFVSGVIVPDVDLIGARGPGAHFSTWANGHAHEVDRARAVGTELSWNDAWIDQVCRMQLAFVCLTMAVDLEELNDEVLELFARRLSEAPSISANHRRVLEGRHQALTRVCYQLGLVTVAPAHPNYRARTIAQRTWAIPQPEINKVVTRYLETISTTLRPKSVYDKAENFVLFFTWLEREHPEISRLADLDRHVVEEFLVWNHGRPSCGRRRRGEPVSVSRQHQAVSVLRTFINDLIFWEWPDRPSRPLLHASDLPRLEEDLPRALTPTDDLALMAGVAQLEDVAARSAIRILRGTGLRLGELLDLEIDCLLDFSKHGTWLRVPIGKLDTERTVPVDQETLTAFDEWIERRGRQRAVPHPRTGRPADLLFMIGGRPIGASRVRRGLAVAIDLAGLTDPSGRPLHVTPHQLRHTYATTLINAGMSLEALMALLGHVSPEMTLRYAHLASDTVRTAYDAAMVKARARQPILIADQRGTIVGNRVDWLHAEMLKTRLAAGLCARHPAAGACTYANICEQCDNFTTAPEFSGTLEAQLADVILLRDDAEIHGWDSEVGRHSKVIEDLERHVERLKRNGSRGSTA